jgi:FkbM family methyltransferase
VPAAETCSFSQCGEDRIARWILRVLGVERPRYLDIGAHHPCQLNNTYLFYRLGGSGVLVEPNPRWTPLIRRERPRDTCLCVGLAAQPRDRVPFHVMTSDTLCTFSKTEGDRMVAECGQEILETRHVDAMTPAEVQAEHFRDGLNFVSLDVEGLELEILQAFDFDANRPEVFCIETLSYSIDGTGRKNRPLIEWMAAQDYAVHADTYVNTIFVDEMRARGTLLPGGNGARP